MDKHFKEPGSAKDWEKHWDEEFAWLVENKVLTQPIFDMIKDFIQRSIEAATRCDKEVEGGTTCGVKLDCHLHDWRSGKNDTLPPLPKEIKIPDTLSGTKEMFGDEWPKWVGMADKFNEIILYLKASK